MVRDKTAIGRHDVGIVVYDGLSLFELGVAYDVFGDDRSEAFGVPWYRLVVCAHAPGKVTAQGGIRIEVRHGLEALRRVDTVIVPPTESPLLVTDDVLDALRSAHRRGLRLVSLCTGAFVLARAGLLDGRRATTHWTECQALARDFPDVEVDAGVLYVDEGDILTSAGSAASIDLCLHLVRNDHGNEIATALARDLVVPPQRDGGQAQFIDAPTRLFEESDLFHEQMAWLLGHLDEPVTVHDLAARSGMSQRTFARHFLAATGTTPYQWLLWQRVALAQRLLEVSDLPMDTVAARSGFSTAGNLRKHFHRVVRTSPQAYRRTFKERTPATPAGPGVPRA